MRARPRSAPCACARPRASPPNAAHTTACQSLHQEMAPSRWRRPLGAAAFMLAALMLAAVHLPRAAASVFTYGELPPARCTRPLHMRGWATRGSDTRWATPNNSRLRRSHVPLPPPSDVATCTELENAVADVGARML